MRVTRRPRPLPRADMTPLVNVALLLIVFFVWVKQVQRPVALQIAGPYRCKCEALPVTPTNSLYLLANNRAGLLTYLPRQKRVDLVEIDLSPARLRKQLALTAQKSHPTLLIIPTPNSTVKNLVDVVDELTINGRISYSIGYEMIPADRRILADYQRYKQANPRRPVSMPITFR